jgi:hypothetical protein
MSNIVGNKIHAGIYLISNVLLHFSCAMFLWNSSTNNQNAFWSISIIGLYITRLASLYLFQLSEEQERLQQVERLVSMLKAENNETDEDNVLLFKKDE